MLSHNAPNSYIFMWLFFHVIFYVEFLLYNKQLQTIYFK